MRGKIDFKGTKEGLVLHIKGDLSFEWIQILVQRKLKQARHFFEGAHIIGSSGYIFTEEQEAILSQLIQAQSGMKVFNLEPFDYARETAVRVPVSQASSENKGAVVNEQQRDILLQSDSETEAEAEFESESSPELKEAEQEILQQPVEPPDEAIVAPFTTNEMETHSPQDMGTYVYGEGKHSEDMTEKVSDTVFHRGTLRSGRRIVSTGNIVVLGDVNPGAELIARGNIIVMGNMRGLAHAGSDGNDKAFVAAIRLMATQIRIDRFISRSPDEGHSDAHYPEIAYILEGQMVIEPYL